MLIRQVACVASGMGAAHRAGKQAAKGPSLCWGAMLLVLHLAAKSCSPYTDSCRPCAGKAALAAAADGAPSVASTAADEGEPPPTKKGRKGKKAAKAAAAAEHRAQEETAAKGRINLNEGERLALHVGYGNSCHHKRFGDLASWYCVLKKHQPAAAFLCWNKLA